MRYQRSKNRVTFSVMAMIVLLCAWALPVNAQDLTGDTLTLDGIPNPRINMDVDAGRYQMIAFDEGFGIYRPDGNLSPFWMDRFATPSMFRIATLGVGVGGVFEPAAGLHIRSRGSTLSNTNAIGEARVIVENTADHSPGLRTMFHLKNPGGIRFDMTNNRLNGRTWAFQTNNSDNFLINLIGSGGNEFSIRKTGLVTMGPGGVHNFLLDPAGNLTIKGTLNQLSDRNNKKSFSEIDEEQILGRIAKLPVTSWQYKKDDPSIRHIGPMAQDFHAAFGVGQDERSISTTDAAGVTFAGIKALLARQVAMQSTMQEELAQKDQQIEELHGRLQEMSLRMERLEASVSR